MRLNCVPAACSGVVVILASRGVPSFRVTLKTALE
jgi:hypothetical protein